MGPNASPVTEQIIFISGASVGPEDDWVFKTQINNLFYFISVGVTYNEIGASVGPEEDDRSKTQINNFLK